MRLGQGGHLVHDHVGPGRGHRLADGLRVQPVHDETLGAQLGQHPELVSARRRRGHLMPPGDQLWHQETPDDAASAGHEHSHRVILLVSELASVPETRQPDRL
jgi:hypothetical protein